MTLLESWRRLSRAIQRARSTYCPWCIKSCAADIQRFLDDEAVLACPPSTSYRARKFIHRHRAPVIAATLFLCLLCLGLVATSLGVIWARKAEKSAVVARDEAKRLARINEQLALRQTRLADEQAKLADSNIQLAEQERDARQGAERKNFARLWGSRPRAFPMSGEGTAGHFLRARRLQR